MRANLSKIWLGFFAGALTFAVGATNARAQAPEGPQGGQKQQGAPPAEQKPAPPPQKPEEAGASIAPPTTAAPTCSSSRRLSPVVMFASLGAPLWFCCRRFSLA